MFTIVTFDASTGAYNQSTVNTEVVKDVRALIPRDYVLMFIIEDDIDVLDVDGDPLEELVL